jgi:hypothetical protein
MSAASIKSPKPAKSAPEPVTPATTPHASPPVDDLLAALDATPGEVLLEVVRVAGQPGAPISDAAFVARDQLRQVELAISEHLTMQGRAHSQLENLERTARPAKSATELRALRDAIQAQDRQVRLSTDALGDAVKSTRSALRDAESALAREREARGLASDQDLGDARARLTRLRAEVDTLAGDINAIDRAAIHVNHTADQLAAALESEAEAVRQKEACKQQHSETMTGIDAAIEEAQAWQDAVNKAAAEMHEAGRQASILNRRANSILDRAERVRQALD